MIMQGPSKLLAGKPLLELLPEPFDGVEFGAAGRQKDVLYVARESEPLGLVEGSVVQHEHVQAMRKRPRKPVQEKLVAVGVEALLLEKEALPRLRFDGSVEVERIVRGLLPTDRL
jgi:hypothetical protein